MTDALQAALAAEEHRQGAPYIADPDHCERCEAIDGAWEQATCEHSETVSIRELCDPYDVRLCIRCGATMEVR